MTQFVKHPKPGRCQVKFCRNPHREGRRMCHKHRQAAWRERNPERAAYANLREHAKQRKLSCALTFEEFCTLCSEIRPFGQTHLPHGQRYSIDRIDVTLGYDPGNLRIITIAENSQKGNKERFLSILRMTAQLGVTEECPF